MLFQETELRGAYIIDVERIEDFRGFFGRVWCADEFKKHGLNPNHVQTNIGFNLKRGTLRGLHFQRAPHEEVKLVRCTTGALYDVIVDLRPDSPTFKRWVSVELTAGNHRMVYVPEGFAQGYQTLVDNTELFYQTSRLFAPNHAFGIRYNDPAFGIKWPLEVTAIADKDKSCPDFTH